MVAYNSAIYVQVKRLLGTIEFCGYMITSILYTIDYSWTDILYTYVVGRCPHGEDMCS